MQTKVHQRPHLAQPLQRGGAGFGDATGVGCTGDIAKAQPAVIVRRADQAVKVDLDETHRARKPVAMEPTGVSASRLATGQAQ